MSSVPNAQAPSRNDLGIYDRLSDDWWSEHGAFRALHDLNAPRFAFFDRFVLRWEGLRVCDVGCGGGFASEALARRGAEVTGVDISERSLDAARAHAAREGLAIRYEKAFAESLPFEDASLDAVLCCDVLEHVQSVPLVVCEAFRVLKPGGLFLFDTINRNVFSRLVTIDIMETLTGAVPRGTHDPALYVKPSEARRYLREAGFEEPRLTGFFPRGISLKRRSVLLVPGGPTWVLYGGVARKPGAPAV